MVYNADTELKGEVKLNGNSVSSASGVLSMVAIPFAPEVAKGIV